MKPFGIYPTDDTICALSTPPGTGAIAIIRLSGADATRICQNFFLPSKTGSQVTGFETHTVHHGFFKNNENIIDEVLLTVFRQPHSYTGEDVVEISCHGSIFIQQQILLTLTAAGARLAERGEFTFRAFLNGKFDLSQAEAVADLIASTSRASHSMAFTQMRGGFSGKLRELRQQLVELASLLELELDFSEEDVEFADRKKLLDLLDTLNGELSRLATSFSLGNVIKLGIPVTIIGKPNVGKSTLLNALLNEERAIVSEIPGTTRDTIEDAITIEGISFRFIDTAGLRSHTSDAIESIGINRTFDKIREASIILYVFDISSVTVEEIEELKEEFKEYIDNPAKHIILIGNKTDLMLEAPPHISALFDMETLFISAKRKENINLITDSLLRTVKTNDFSDLAIVNNARHHEALSLTMDALAEARNGLLSNLPSDLVATDIHSALYHLGSITGEITTEDVLGSIFSRFCVGK